MPKAVTKLFREPQQAEKMIAELEAQGYGKEEIGILISERRDGERFAPKLTPIAKGLSLPEAGAIIAKGAIASAMSEGSDLKALLGELGISDETLSYYQLGLFWGGIVVSVHTEEARLEQARQLLRKEAKPIAGVERVKMWGSCPPFDIASRMSETNPIDAPMTGDFRRY
jgi:hypothetical protein